MLSQPAFKSHTDQIALLGSAAVMDAEKFPRRAALAAARAKRRPAHLPRPLVAEPLERRRNLAPRIAELAKTMSISQVERETGCSRTLLQRIAAENDFAFAQMRPGTKSLKQVVDTFLVQTDGS